MHARSRAALSRAEEEGGQRARDKSTLASFIIESLNHPTWEYIDTRTK
jgi:hypothetical protein